MVRTNLEIKDSWCYFNKVEIGTAFKVNGAYYIKIGGSADANAICIYDPEEGANTTLWGTAFHELDEVQTNINVEINITA